VEKNFVMRSFIIHTLFQISSWLSDQGDEWLGHVVYVGEVRNAFKILVRKFEGKRLFGRPQHRWKIMLKFMLKRYGMRM
jgi:hypothetical protein